MNEILIISAAYVISCIGLYAFQRASARDREYREYLRGFQAGYKEAIDFAITVIDRKEEA